MAPRQTASTHNTITAIAVLFLLGAWHAAPALAASDLEILREDSHSVTLEITEYELIPRQVSHDMDASELANLASSEAGVLAKDHLLKPRVEATVREVFADSEGNSRVEEEDVTDLEESTIRELVSGPRMTDGHPVSFKRQMYRKDI